MDKASTSSNPDLSVVVALISGRPEHLEACLTALMQQVDPPSMEIIVACDEQVGDLTQLQTAFPSVQFLFPIGLSGAARSGWNREYHDELRAVGLRRARGKLVALLQDDCVPEDRWCGAVVTGHAGPYAAVGGAVENGTDRVLNWALYFCDFGQYQKPVPRGTVTNVSDCNASYKRKALERIADVWTNSFQEPIVNSALLARGEVLWMSPDLVVWQKRESLRFRVAIQERYVGGRSFAGKRAARIALRDRIFYATFSCLLPLLLLARMGATAFHRRLRLGVFIRAVPMIMLLTAFWSLGELVGYVTGRPVALPRKGKGEQ